MRTWLSLGAVLAALAVCLLERPADAPVIDVSHPDMVFVRAGPFVMGNDDDDVRQALAAYGDSLEFFRAEVPRRTIDLPAFWIDRTEVTNGMYRAFVDATGHRVPDETTVWAAPYRWQGGTYPPGLRDHPVTLVSSEDAADYCRWRGMRVPSEEEWEKAARGAGGRTYPWGDRWAVWRVAGADQRSTTPLDRLDRWTDWWRATYLGRMRGREVGTFPVGSFPAGTSPWGALDMAGNVFEWVDADFEPYPGSPFGHPEFGQELRVVRGGDWYLGRIYHRAAARSRAPADHRVPTIGFRCACDTPGDRHPPVEAR